MEARALKRGGAREAPFAFPATLETQVAGRAREAGLTAARAEATGTTMEQTAADMFRVGRESL
tara:strand:- start:6 stop:194 length:189 start_codon:yes stop_codon:yes gene_type:complete